jgi:hypothetical protein
VRQGWVSWFLLDSIIYDEILAEAEHTADMRNCFIEADIISMDDPERSWLSIIECPLL